MQERIISYDPCTLEPVGDVAVTSPESIGAVVECSRKVFAEWSSLEHDDRRIVLRAFKRTVLDRGHEVARTVASETGKPVGDAYAFDVVTSLTVMDHYLRHAHSYLKPRRAGSWPYLSTRGWTEYHPRGSWA